MTYARKAVRKVRDLVLAQRHKKGLSRRFADAGDEYRHYLNAQLRRTLQKKRSPLQFRTRLLADKAAEFVDMAGCDVLCIGCRNTAEIDYFRSKGAKSVVGIDLYTESKDVLVMDMHSMTFTGDRFDAVYASHSLEHAYDIGEVAKEIVRVARSGALVALEVPLKYETTAADLHDFDSLPKLYSYFEPQASPVLWSDEQPARSPLNPAGTPVGRMVFSVRK